MVAKAKIGVPSGRTLIGALLVDCSFHDMHNVTFKNCTFINCDFQSAKLKRVIFVDCTFIPPHKFRPSQTGYACTRRWPRQRRLTAPPTTTRLHALLGVTPR